MDPLLEPRPVRDTLLLSRADVERLLTPRLCADAVEHAFRALGAGAVPPPGILGMHTGTGGSFHVKAGFLAAGRPFFAAKLNANFPSNPAQGLPTIQGAVMLFDAADGTLLAIMDSMSVTALRTAAATAIAAKYLARESCGTLLVCGCGGQGPAQVRALLEFRRPRRVLAHDLDAAKAHAFCDTMRRELGLEAEVATDFAAAASRSDIVVTCTSARRYFITKEMIRPGTFIAAVGADAEHKQEIEPALMAAATVVTDLTGQAAKIGDLHHAIDAGSMTLEDVHAELAEVVAGLQPGRTREDEIIVFDSTGTGLQDVASAIAVYDEARRTRSGCGYALSSDGAARTG